MMDLRERFRAKRHRIQYEIPLELFRERGLLYAQLKKFYSYLKILASIYWGIPLMLALAWYIIIYQACTSTMFRGLVENICTGPYLSPTNKVPWYLDLWDALEIATDANYSRSPISPSLERIIVGHLRLRDATKALVYQVSVMEQMAPGFVTDIMSRDLGQIEAMATDLYPSLENFSRTFCNEKDVLNHELRTFTNIYARAIGRSRYKEFSWLSICLWPFWDYFLGFINHYLQFSWLPDPQLYSHQIKPEIRFQAKRFVDRSLASLGRIDYSYSTMQQIHTSGPLIQRLGILNVTLNTNQRILNQTAEDLQQKSSLGIFFPSIISSVLPAAKDLQALDERYACGEKIRSSVSAVIENIPIYELDSTRLKAQLHQFYTALDHAASFATSSQGLIAIPADLRAQIRLPHFSWLRPSWNEGGLVVKTIASDVYQYNLDVIGDTDLPSYRSALAQLCGECRSDDMVSGSLYMICNIWNYVMTMQELDDNILNDVQRRWDLERLEAIHQYEKETAINYKHMATLAASVFLDSASYTSV